MFSKCFQNGSIIESALLLFIIKKAHVDLQTATVSVKKNSTFKVFNVMTITFFVE